MKKLLRFELRRIFLQKSFYVCSLIMLVGCVLMISMFFAVRNTSAMSADGLIVAANKGIDFTGKYFMMTAVSGSSIGTILAIFISLYICGNFSSGTIKNILSRGYSRNKLLVVSNIASFTVAVIMTFICLVCGFVMGSLLGKIGTGWSAGLIPILLAQLLTVIAFTSVYTAVAFLVRKTGAAIAVSILISIVTSLVASLLDVLLFKDAAFKTSDYLLTQVLTNVSSISVSSEILAKSIICAAVYLLIGLFISFVAFRKREV